jgi:protein ImuA
MQLLSCHGGKLLKVDSADLSAAAPQRSFATGLAALDRLLPNGALARGAIHEVLWGAKDPRPLFFAAWLARAACGHGRDAPPLFGRAASAAPSSRNTNHAPTANAAGPRVVWCDPRREIYPPALAAAGIALEQLLLLRPRTAEEEVWALAECLKCKGVAATLAQPPPLSRVQARRLQLAAERGGGVGLLLRPHNADAAHHAAVTRWLVEPARGERTVQRWKIQLVHGHGGLLHHPVYLECSRDRHETDRVRATDQLADRPSTAAATKPAIA